MDIGAAKTCTHSGATLSYYRILPPPSSSSSSSCSSSIIQCVSCSNAERIRPVSKKELAAEGGQQRRREQEKKKPVKAVAHQGSPQPPSSAKGAEAKQRTQEHYDCVVVGAGISGLTTAQALATRHSAQVTRVLVTEAQSCVGGNIATVERDGYLWEEGPNSFQPSDPILTLVKLGSAAGISDFLKQRRKPDSETPMAD